MERAPGRRCMCTRQTATLFCYVKNDVMVAILKVWRHIKKPTPSIEQSFQISPRSDLKRRSLGFFEECRPIRIKKNNNSKIEAE